MGAFERTGAEWWLQWPRPWLGLGVRTPGSGAVEGSARGTPSLPSHPSTSPHLLCGVQVTPTFRIFNFTSGVSLLPSQWSERYLEPRTSTAL